MEKIEKLSNPKVMKEITYQVTETHQKVSG